MPNLVASLLLALALAVAPGAASVDVTPGSGPAGTRVTVTGSGFASGPVDIRWGDASGPVIASAGGPDFTVEATVPNGPAGSGSVVAVPRAGDAASAAFLVTAAGSSPAPDIGRFDGVGGGLAPAGGGGDPAPAPGPGQGNRSGSTGSPSAATGAGGAGDGSAAPGSGAAGAAPGAAATAGTAPGGAAGGAGAEGLTDPTGPVGAPGDGFGATPDDDRRALGRTRRAVDEGFGAGPGPAVVVSGVLLLGLVGAWFRRRRQPPRVDGLWE